MILPKPALIESEILEFFAGRNFERSRRFSPGSYDPKNVQQFLALLGNPQHSYQTIHVAGTVGKGSTTTYLARAIQALGFRTGAYLSPHFVSLRERAVINGAAISATDLTDLWREIRSFPQINSLTFFDAMTALAFLHFRRKNCHWAVIETGLGGRLDSTNNLHSQAAVITRIDMDHRHILGNSITEIAREKAGIINQSQHVYTPEQSAEAMAVLVEVCARQGARLTRVETRGDSFTTRNLDAACQIIRQELGVPEATMTQVAREIDKPIFGRWSELRRAPRVVFDGAHNAAGIEALAALVNRQPESECNIFINTMKERDLKELCDLLRKQVKKHLRLCLFGMPEAIYFQPADVAPGIETPVDDGIAELISVPGTLNIFTGSMAIYAELSRRFAL